MKKIALTIAALVVSAAMIMAFTSCSKTPEEADTTAANAAVADVAEDINKTADEIITPAADALEEASEAISEIAE